MAAPVPRRCAAPDAFATELKRGVASLSEDLRLAIPSHKATNQIALPH
jgi:hypothetical protein